MSRFQLLARPYASTDAVAQFKVPSAGILKNITAIIYYNGNEEWSVHFGSIPLDNAVLVPPSADTLVPTKGKRSADYWRVDALDFESPDTILRGQYVAHRAQPMFLRRDKIYKLVFSRGSTNTDAFVVITGEFVPYDNADYEYTMVFDAAESISNNYNRRYCVPDNLENVIVHYDIVNNDSGATLEQGYIHIRMLGRDEQVETSTMTGQGLIDGSFDVTGDTIFGGYGEDVLVQNAVGGFNRSQGSFVVRDKVRSGDGISFDTTQISGTLADCYTKIKINGKAQRLGRSQFKSYYLEGNLLMNPIGIGGA